MLISQQLVHFSYRVFFPLLSVVVDQSTHARTNAALFFAEVLNRPDLTEP